jgi:hypothetical protein
VPGPVSREPHLPYLSINIFTSSSPHRLISQDLNDHHPTSLLYVDSHATGNITAEDVRDLHARAISNPSNMAILGIGISTESQALRDRRLVHKTSAATSTPSAIPVPTMAYHGSTTHVASAHGPQAVFIGFGSTSSTSVTRAHSTSESCTCAQMGLATSWLLTPFLLFFDSSHRPGAALTCALLFVLVGISPTQALSKARCR